MTRDTPTPTRCAWDPRGGGPDLVDRDFKGRRVRHRFFAPILARIMESGEEHGQTDLRRETLAGLQGRVLELGAGTGLLAAAISAIVWPLRHRLRRTLDLTWLVLGLFTLGRFAEFFVRSDGPQLALGVGNAQ